MILRAVVGLVYAFLLLPLVIVVLAAFNAGNYFTFPPQGFSLKWFQLQVNALSISQVEVSAPS